MELISTDQWLQQLGAAQDVRKVELRDHYSADEKLFADWQSGDLDAVDASYQGWREFFVTKYVEAGRTFRRVRVVSEPLSAYQEMALTYSGATVDLGEGLRWLPRRLVSTLALPGNDFFVLDEQTAIFTVLDAMAKEVVQVQRATEPAELRFCREAFDAAWDLAVPHHDYRARMIHA
ncbi:hypothetical protein GCM10010411_75020 [Actinomadura fulvescens]|uniref:DUF6879 domain-containing protein n=1 Tax=Actinomadura fulvescens TaxID=46160 RepID=A0ABP6CUN3_9ACTN